MSTSTTTTNTNNQPVDRVRIGRIEAAIWENQSDKGSTFTVTIKRRYRVNDEWKATPSMGRDDLLLLAKVADLAHSRILELQAEHWQSINAEKGAAA